MRRPLCVVSITFFIVQIFATILPQQVLMPIAAVFGLLAVIIVFSKKSELYIIVVIAVSTILSLLYHDFYKTNSIKPLLKLINSESTIVARVDETVTYANDVMSAVLTVEQISGIKTEQFKVYLDLMPSAEKGEYITFKLAFKPLQPSKTNFYYSKGVFVAAKYLGDFDILENKSFLYHFANLQAKLANSFKDVSSENNGQIGAAMAFGYKTDLNYEIRESFRNAGLSHLLVVSGMHLAAVSGMVFAISGFVFKRRKIQAAISIFASILFILLTGITFSSIRAGVMLCIIYIGMFFWRKADTFTTLCTALLLLVLQNPFIFGDLSFLLSFTSTGGIIAGNAAMSFYSKCSIFRTHKMMTKIIRILMVPISATIATAPVLLIFGVGISSLGFIFNIFTVPLLPFIVALVFVTSIINFVPQLILFAHGVSYITQLLISFVYQIALISENFIFSTIYEQGIAIAVFLYIIYFLTYLGLKLKIKFFYLYIAAFAMLSIFIMHKIESNIVAIEALDTTQNAAIAIYNSDQCAIIYRETQLNPSVIDKFLKQKNINKVDFEIFLYEPDKPYPIIADRGIMVKEISNTYTTDLFDDIILTIKKQKNSCAALLNISGITIAINRGEYDFNAIGRVDIFISGLSAAKNLLSTDIITNNTVPKWILKNNLPFTTTAIAKVKVRKGKSYKIYEGYYGIN